MLGCSSANEKRHTRNFPAGPVIKTSPSNAQGASLILGQGARITHGLWPKKQNIKQKQYCNKFSKDFGNGPRQENLKKRNKKRKRHTLGVGV